MIRKYAKIIGILCKCAILAVKIEWYDRKSRRLTRKGDRYAADIATAKVLGLCMLAHSYVDYGKKLLKEG